MTKCAYCPIECNVDVYADGKRSPVICEKCGDQRGLTHASNAEVVDYLRKDGKLKML